MLFMQFKKVKILYIVYDLSRGGAQTVLYNLIKLLPSSRYEVEIMFIHNNESMRSEFETLGVKTTFFSNQSLSKKFFSFRRAIKKAAPDIVHSHLPAGFFTIYLFLKLSGVKNILKSIHRTSFEFSTLDKLLEYLIQYLISGYIHVSKSSAKQYSNFFRINHKQNNIVYNGIPLDDIKNQNEKVSFSKNGFHIISIGNFHTLKGYKYAISGLEPILKKHNNIFYHIIGDVHYDLDVKDKIIDDINNHNLSSQVIMHGEVKNVIPYLKSSDLFLTPSEKELLPVSILEAMACNLPIIATDTGGISEIIGKNNEYGLLIKIKNSKEIENAVFMLFNDEKLRNLYCKRSEERVKFFNAEKTAHNYIKHYQKLIDI